MGAHPVNNRKVLSQSGQLPIICRIIYLQLAYLGHVLRRLPWDPLRSVVFDRFLGFRVLGGRRRPGVPREAWSDKV
eukprot:5572025-Alexandrium_andersonii.AAC.1